jgi:hypothetical protein
LSRWWLLLAFAVAFFAIATTSRAAYGTPAAQDACKAVAALPGAVSEDERTALAAVCHGTQDLPPAKLAELLAKLEVEPSWQTALLLRLAAPSLPVSSKKPEVRAASAALNGQSKCGSEALQKDAAERRRGQTADFPLTVELLSKKPCVDETLSKLLQPSTMAVLTIVGEPGDSVSIALKVGNAWTAERIDSFVDAEGYRYFFTIVPRQSTAIARHQHVGDLQPATVVVPGVVARDTTPSSLPDENARSCMEFRVRANQGLLLVDGDPVPLLSDGVLADGTQRWWVRRYVRRDFHELTLLSLSTQAPVNLRIRPEDLPEQACFSRVFDLRQKQQSTLFITADDDCTKHGVVQPRLQIYASQYLRSALAGKAESFVDLAEWGSALDKINQLQRSIAVGGATPVGGNRGNLDVNATLQAVAGELLRQGFSKAYLGHMSCGESSGTVNYTFVVHRLGLGALQQSEQNDETGITGLANGLDTEHETTTQIDDLRDIIRAPLARLLNVPYVRLVTEDRERHVYDDRSYLLEAWRPDKSVFANALLLRREAADSFCEGIRRRRRLVETRPFTQPPPHQRYVDDIDNVEFPAPADEIASQRLPGEPLASTRLSFSFDAGAIYAIEVGIRGQPDSVSFTCVTVEGDEGSHRYWFELSAATSPGMHDELHDDNRYVAALMGVTTGQSWMLSRRVKFALPFVVGYEALFRRATTPPSWRDLGAGVAFSDGGELALSWNRQGLLLGPAPEIHLQIACGLSDFARDVAWSLGASKSPAGCPGWSRLDMFLRAGILLDAGIVFSHGLPDGLREFRAGREPGSSIVDLDVSGFADLGLALRLNRHLDVSLYGTAWYLGLSDVDSWTMTYQRVGLFGGGAGIGYWP